MYICTFDVFNNSRVLDRTKNINKFILIQVSDDAASHAEHQSYPSAQMNPKVKLLRAKRPNELYQRNEMCSPNYEAATKQSCKTTYVAMFKR